MRNTERLYTTLLFRASRKYPSWDPEIPMEVGDYGIITSGAKERSWKSMFRKRRPKQRGVFLKEGNVYHEGIAEKHGLPVPKEYGDGDNSGVTWIVSDKTQEIDVEAAAGGQTPVLVECKVKAAFRFSSKVGAVLVMENDTITAVQPAGKLRFLFDEPSLHGKVVVSEVHRCSSYARYVSSGKESSVAFGLSATSPEGAQGLVGDVSTGVESKWVKSVSSGNFKTRSRKDKVRAYYPLFKLVTLDEKKLTGGLRGGEEGVGDPPLPDVVPPWMEDGDNAEADVLSLAVSESSDTDSSSENHSPRRKSRGWF